MFVRCRQIRQKQSKRKACASARHQGQDRLVWLIQIPVSKTSTESTPRANSIRHQDCVKKEIDRRGFADRAYETAYAFDETD